MDKQKQAILDAATPAVIEEQRAVITLADMPPGTIANISGNDFPQFKGLLQIGHRFGMQSAESDLVDLSDTGRAIVKAVIVGTRGRYSAYGDASPDNVPRGAESEVIRRAETRAYSRALRLYLGIGDCAADELSDDARRGRQGSSQVTRRPQERQSPPMASGQNQKAARPGDWEPPDGDASRKCPACGAAVYDNRATAQGKQPLWRCSAGKTCNGGRGNFGWGSWDADYFDNQDAARDYTAEQSPADPSSPSDADLEAMASAAQSHDESDIPF